MKSQFLRLLLLSTCLCEKGAICKDVITKISTRTSTIPGSGMDSDFSFFGLDTGGGFEMRLCGGEAGCCQTGELNTEDDNWELGQVDWFVGRQIGECEGWAIGDKETEVRLNIQHSGPNAGLLDWVKLHTWDLDREWVCQVGVRLDYDNSYTTTCKLGVKHNNNDDDIRCNGRSEFCSLGFDQFLFPGTHNAGTGQSKGSWACAYKNQDLNIVEQLEFGIRFFDLDVIFSHAFGCHGLETGHGTSPELGLYQCYGLMTSLLSDLRRWLDSHPSEVVVLHFGNIEYPAETVPALLETLAETFSAQSTSVKLNAKFKETGSWPSLGEAVAANERVFVFVRDTVGALTERDTQYVREIKVKPRETFNITTGPGEVSVLTSYLARDVDGDCVYLLESNAFACDKDAEWGTDFLKLSFFSKFGKGGTFGTECIHKMARKCNVWPISAVENCTVREFRPNFILLDYPNYQSNAKITAVQLCQEINIARASKIRSKTEK